MRDARTRLEFAHIPDVPEVEIDDAETVDWGEPVTEADVEAQRNVPPTFVRARGESPVLKVILEGSIAGRRLA